MAITKDQLGATLDITAKVTFIELTKDKNNNADSEVLKMRIKFGSTQIFIFEFKPSLIKRMSRYKINDIIQLKGNFLAPWYPGAKSSIPTIDKVLTVKKLGSLKKS